MGNYASTAKLSELRLADESESPVESPADPGCPPPAADNVIREADEHGPASVLPLTELRLADEPAPPARSSIGTDSPSSTRGGASRDVEGNAQSPDLKMPGLRLASEPAQAVEPAARGNASPVTSVSEKRDVESSSMDACLKAAAQEFEAGTIDQMLWLRAVKQSGANAEKAKVVYLGARARALRIMNRSKRGDSPARVTRIRSVAPEDPDDTPSENTRRSGKARIRRVRLSSRSKRLTLIAVVLGISVLAGGYLAFQPATDPVPMPTTDPARPTELSGTPAPPARSKQATLMDNAKSAYAKARDVGHPNVTSEDFAKKVQELKDAGNWNVVVLYAVEWTRKHPESPDAWNELSMGYSRLRQYNDALEAATKAVQLAPENFKAWQNLGEVNVALQLPAAALAAFERAAELNARDVTSLVQIGALNAQLGQLPPARIAFGKALEVSPLDVDALCGAASIAQKEGHSKDAEGFTRQLKSASLQCRGASAAESVSVAAAPPVKKNVAPATAR
jgi:tetratricopeptide (TPR) repeat protein